VGVRGKIGSAQPIGGDEGAEGVKGERMGLGKKAMGACGNDVPGKKTGT